LSSLRISIRFKWNHQQRKVANGSRKIVSRLTYRQACKLLGEQGEVDPARRRLEIDITERVAFNKSSSEEVASIIRWRKRLSNAFVTIQLAAERDYLRWENGLRYSVDISEQPFPDPEDKMALGLAATQPSASAGKSQR
jgi:hypothetical protein